jgi:RecF/RecN/SMC N terminal domain
MSGAWRPVILVGDVAPRGLLRRNDWPLDFRFRGIMTLLFRYGWGADGAARAAQGIVFSVRPPKKSWKNIANLSGGEKTLSSLSLVFALHHFKPTPLYFMDEIDAALDFKNVSIVAHYVKEQTRCACPLASRGRLFAFRRPHCFRLFQLLFASVRVVKFSPPFPPSGIPCASAVVPATDADVASSM